MLSPQKIKILIITSRADWGGGPRHIYELSKNLKKDFSFYFATPKDYPYFQKFCELVQEENIVEIPHRKFRLHTLFKLLNFIKREKIDIVHSHGKGAGIYSRMIRLFFNIKTIHTFHGIHIGNYNVLQRLFYLKLEKFFSLLTNQFISVSNDETQVILNYHIVKRKKIKVILNGVDIPIYSVSENNFYQKPKNIITFSRFDYAKNTELLISILIELRKLNHINEFRFLIYGEGPNQEKFWKMVIDNSLTNYVCLKGTTEETTKILLNSFCYISTSLWEGMPLGVLEAFSCGLPVIATNVVGNREAVSHNGDGFLFGINVPKEAAEAIIMLASKKNIWVEFSHNAKMKAETNYSVTKMVNETKSVYYELLQQRKKLF